MSTQGQIIEAIDAEISKAKRRLDIVYNEVEEMKKDKLVIENDVKVLDKHIKYLAEIDTQKESEIKIKENTIKGINSQLSDRQKELDDLQGQVSKSNSILENNRNELFLIEEKRKEHNEAIVRDRESVHQSKQDLSHKHSQVDEKLEKIKKLLSEI